MNIQGWIPFRWLIWYPCSPRDSEESSPRLQFKSINSSVLSLLYGPALKTILDYRKALTLTIQSVVGKVMSLLFNILSRLVIAFLTMSKCILVSWLQSPSAASFSTLSNIPLYAYRLWSVFPGGTSGKEPTCHGRRHTRCGFDPWVQPLGWKDPLEEERATHFRSLA